MPAAFVARMPTWGVLDHHTRARLAKRVDVASPWMSVKVSAFLLSFGPSPVMLRGMASAIFAFHRLALQPIFLFNNPIPRSHMFGVSPSKLQLLG